MIWSARTDWPLTSNNLIKTNSLRGNQESRFKNRDFGQNNLGTTYHSSKTNDQMADQAIEKRSIDFWTDMLAEDMHGF